MGEQPTNHEILYSDPKRVRTSRREAESLIAQRKLRRLLIDSWAVPALNWLDRKLTRHAD